MLRLPGRDPHVMKEILLGVAGIRTEVSGDEAFQPVRRGTTLRKIQMAQRFLYPDVHRKGFLESVGEQQNAIGNLFADAPDPQQFLASFGHGQVPQRRQVEFALGYPPRCCMQIRSSKAHLAGAQFGLGCRRQPFRRGKCESGAAPVRSVASAANPPRPSPRKRRRSPT